METILTILHIDDDPDTRLLLQELLSQAGPAASEPATIRFLEAGGVEEALIRYRESQPDVILLDHRLGEDSGLDLLPSVRRAWSCPVWLVTGFSPETLEERAAKAGSAGIIHKDELLAGAAGLRSRLLACCAPAAGNGSNLPIER
ncbi:MAG TPA: response regulator [Bryobacterales bacterium]|nr:response regulator [Bryobacterales bacterium]